MTPLIKPLTRWSGGDEKIFVVLYVLETDGHVWVHYRNEKTGQEYNCYQESFLTRFRPLPE